MRLVFFLDFYVIFFILHNETFVVLSMCYIVIASTVRSRYPFVTRVGLKVLKSRFSLNIWIDHKANLPICRRDWSLVKTCYSASIMALILSSLCAKSCRTLWTENLDRGSPTRRTLSKLLWAFVMDSEFFSAKSKSCFPLGCFLNSITHSVVPSAKASIWGDKLIC